MANNDFISQKLSDPLTGLADTDWHQSFIEDTDLYLCRPEIIAQAHREAPTPEARGYVYGISESRRRMALMAG